MSEERTLANIAQTAYWTVSENQDTFDRVAKAVAKYLDTLKSEGIIITSKRTVWKKQVEYFRLARGYLEVVSE